MAFTKMLYLIPLFAWSCEYKPPTPPALRTAHGADSGQEAGQAGKAEGEGGGTTCDKSSAPVVIYNKEKSEFQYCDRGAWVKVAQNEAEHMVAPEHGKHETRLPKETKAAEHEKPLVEHAASGAAKLEPRRRDSETYHCRTSTKHSQSYICSRFVAGVPEKSGS